VRHCDIPWKEELHEVSSKTCNFVLLQLISSPICEHSLCSISRARTSIFNILASKRHHPHNLNPHRSPCPQLHQENIYGQHGSWSNPWVPDKSSGATTQPRRTPEEVSNHGDSSPSTLTQLKVLLYRSSRSWNIFSAIPLDQSSNHKDCLSTESKADRKSTYATQLKMVFLYSRLVCRIMLRVAIRSMVDLWGVKPLCSVWQRWWRTVCFDPVK